MTTYYPGPEVLITDESLVVLEPARDPAPGNRSPSPRTEFRLDELTNVHIVRGDTHPSRMLSARAAGASAIVVAASWPWTDSAGAHLIGLAMVAVPAALNGACCWLWPREYDLRAFWRGREVVLYRSSDTTRFGQVQRALLRALEAAGSGGLTGSGRRVY